MTRPGIRGWQGSGGGGRGGAPERPSPVSLTRPRAAPTSLAADPEADFWVVVVDLAKVLRTSVTFGSVTEVCFEQLAEPAEPGQLDPGWKYLGQEVGCHAMFPVEPPNQRQKEKDNFVAAPTGGRVGLLRGRL